MSGHQQIRNGNEVFLDTSFFSLLTSREVLRKLLADIADVSKNILPLPAETFRLQLVFDNEKFIIIICGSKNFI